ncbi:MAG: Holliday junction branch migration protein RuvA [Candidatus Aenigmatarchaeota archaeon]
MISRIRGKLAKKEENKVVLEVNGIFYEIIVPPTVFSSLNTNNETVELVIYYYFNVEKHRVVPTLIGFIDELEKKFFEKFISVSGIGPKAALKALEKPISLIAKAIEEADLDFLKTLEGIGTQKAKQIIASLQGKVGRFALIKSGEPKKEPIKKEIVEEAKQVLKRLQYSAKEIEEMIKKALDTKPKVESLEDFLNEIYRQKVS